MSGASILEPLFNPPSFARLVVEETTFFLLAASIGSLLLLSLVLVLATAVLRLKNNWKAAHWARLEAEWTPILLDILAGSGHPSMLWERVEERHRLYFIDFLFRYARRVRGTDAEILLELARPVLSTVAERMKGGDPERRARAVETVSLLGLRDYAPQVVAALNDPSPLVAMIAARTLCRRESPDYATVVLDRLHRFDQWSPRYLSTMLAAMGPNAAPALRVTLQDRGRPASVRVIVAGALQLLHDPAAADVAAEVAATETDQDLRAAALRLLGSVGRTSHLPVVRTLCASPDFVVRAQAVAALGRIGNAHDLEHLHAAFDDASPWVAIHAARGLREIGEVRVLHTAIRTNDPRSHLARQVLTELT
jgi:HEAT repeat protein